MNKFPILLICMLFSFPAVGQSENEEDVKRPPDIKVVDYDDFKNTSYDTYDESLKLKENLGVLDNDIKNYAGVMKSVLTPKLKEDLKALAVIRSSSETLKSKIVSLDEKGKSLAANSKKAGLKAPAAAKNTNSSVAVLGRSRSNLDNIMDMLQTDIKLIQDELKARGEPIE